MSARNGRADSVKFLLFSDLHHYPRMFKGGTWDDLARIHRHAEAAEVDFIIHAGDFCHGPSIDPGYVDAYNRFHIPSYHCLGNHDADKDSFEDTIRAYNMPDGHYYFDVKGVRMIVLNPNFCYYEGEYIHYSLSNYYKLGECRDYMPPEQIEWLRDTIDASPYPCILISHESFERCDGVRNREAVLAVINAANQKKPHSVLMAINGHHHRDNLRILDGVLYFDMNSATQDWLENKHDLYPEEECAKIGCLSHVVCFNDPLHAIVTVEGSTITIEGMETTMYLGITREMTGNPPFDRAGRPVVPRVQSAKITL